MNKMNLFFVMLVVAVSTITAQTSSKTLKIPTQKEKESVVMTWNKDTPDQEMQDDVKALAAYGVTITYRDVKRNDKGEITGLRVSFEDKNGNKGSLSYDTKNPINTIRFYKNGDEVGFGSPSTGADFPMLMEWGQMGSPLQSFRYQFDDEKDFSDPMLEEDRKQFQNQKSKIIIKKDGKKPLVIEDGEVVEGGEGYTPEEIEEYKKSMTVTPEGDESYRFNFGHRNDLNALREQMERMQRQLDQLMPQSDATTEEAEKTAKELEQAKKELDDAKKELQKTKSSLKVKKA